MVRRKCFCKGAKPKSISNLPTYMLVGGGWYFRSSQRVIHTEVCARQCLGKMLKYFVELKVLTKVERLLLDGTAWANKRDHLSLTVSKAAPRNVNSSNFSSRSSILCFPEVTQSAAGAPVPSLWKFADYQLQNAYAVCHRVGSKQAYVLHRGHQAFLCSATLWGVMEGTLASSQTPITLHCYWLLSGIVLLRQGLIFEPWLA